MQNSVYKRFISLILSFVIFVLSGCDKEKTKPFSPTPYTLEIPEIFEENILAPTIPIDNPLTQEGVALGKQLFFDKQLSSNNSISCASCHAPRLAFSDNQARSLGATEKRGTRNAMPLFNLAWNYNDRFAWDGKELGLENQVFEPITNPIEMHGDWTEIIDYLQSNEDYSNHFQHAFGDIEITKELLAQAIAQYERTLISANTKFDRYTLGDEKLTEDELRGLDVFLSEEKGDCFHCHGSPKNPLWTDNEFHNNGLDEEFSDLGLGAVTGDPQDNGKFRTPSLRNLIFTAPYMHDGRFKTLLEIIDHYSEGLKHSETIDPLMKNVEQGGVRLSPEEKDDLIAFLLTLTDSSFVEEHDCSGCF